MEFFGRDAAPAASPPAFSGRKIGQIRLGNISRCAAERGADGAGAPSLPIFVQSPPRERVKLCPVRTRFARFSTESSAPPLQRQHDADNRAFPFFRAEGEFAVMRFDDAMDDGQPEAGAGALGGVEQ